MMLGWGEMPNNWDLLAYQVSLEEPKEGCLVSSSSACLGSVGPVDQADSYGMETMTLVARKHRLKAKELFSYNQKKRELQMKNLYKDAANPINDF